MKVTARKLLDKAERAITTGKANLDLPDPEAAAGRAYYAMFYAAEALLTEEGLKFKKHAGVHGAFGQHFAKSGRLDPKFHKWMLAAFKKRVIADYGIEEAVAPSQARESIEQARELVDAVRRLLEGGT